MTPREQETELSAEVERELRALDHALAGLPVDNDLEGVAEIARALRTERPEPSEDFIESLDAKAAADFADGGSRVGRAVARLFNLRSRREKPGPSIRRSAIWGGGFATVAVGVALIAFVGVTVSMLGTGGTGGDDSSLEFTATTAADSAASDESADSGGATASPDVGTEALGDAGSDPATAAAPEQEGLPFTDEGAGSRSRANGGQDERKVQRDAQLALSTAPDDVRRVADESIEVIEANDGIVLNSEIRDNRDDSSVAELNVNVPTELLTPTLSQLSDLAMVESRRDATEDITSSFRSAQTRLQDFQAERESLLTRLADATTDQESESIRRRLRIVDGRIATARTALNQVERRADLATINLTVRGNGTASTGSTIDAAADDAVDVLKFLASVGIVAAAVIVPLGALLLIGWLIRRRIVHGQREQALDS